MAGDVWDFCCSHHGPRCLMEAMRHALVQHDDGLRLNLHLPVAASFTWPNAKAEATVQFDPNQPGYAILFGNQTAGRFDVRLRRPAWARNLRVKAAGKQVSDGPGGDVIVAGTWKADDRIVCSYQPAVAIHADSTPPVRRFAIQRGPLVLAATDATTRSSGGVDIVCKKTDTSRRITGHMPPGHWPWAVKAVSNRQTAVRPAANRLATLRHFVCRIASPPSETG